MAIQSRIYLILAPGAECLVSRELILISINVYLRQCMHYGELKVQMHLFNSKSARAHVFSFYQLGYKEAGGAGRRRW